MNFFNFLSNETVPFIVERINSIDLNWIGKIISWLFNLFEGIPGAIALGSIVFTLALKTLVLPLDTYSRVKSKKQSLLMEKMRPQMEKLQKQYENDKNMYSQKVMELQKANGYNPLSACLPTLVSIIIFMIIFSAFSTYSNFATLNTYNKLVDAYNASVEIYVVQEETAEDDNSRFLEEYKNGEYFVNYDKFEKHISAVVEESGNEAGVSDIYNRFKEGKSRKEKGENNAEAYMNEAVVDFVRINARRAAADYYENDPNGRAATSFLWIGNMWYPDSMLNKEMPSYSNFRSAISRAVGSGMSEYYEESYNEVTADLSNYKNNYNGYFVLILLSIGLMFLQQFIMMRSQKAANELSTVDGSAGKTNKWMMILMPIIFGVFSFLYSAAFSLYMITSTFYGLISTLIINKIVAVRFAKKEIEVEASGGRKPINRKRLK